MLFVYRGKKSLRPRCLLRYLGSHLCLSCCFRGRFRGALAGARRFLSRFLTVEGTETFEAGKRRAKCNTMADSARCRETVVEDADLDLVTGSGAADRVDAKPLRGLSDALPTLRLWRRSSPLTMPGRRVGADPVRSSRAPCQMPGPRRHRRRCPVGPTSKWSQPCFLTTKSGGCHTDVEDRDHRVDAGRVTHSRGHHRPGLGRHSEAVRPVRRPDSDRDRRDLHHCLHRTYRRSPRIASRRFASRC